jgi:hypothetical protein
MQKIALTSIALAIAVSASPALAAKPDCYGGYKSYLGKVNPYIGQIEDVDLPTLMRRGLSVYDACMAGDNFTPNTWGDLVTEMQNAAAKKK